MVTQPAPTHPSAPAPASADAPPAILVRDLTAAYGSTVILDQVNFTVASGEILVVAGGSGCGKSTLLKNLVGLMTPVKGQVLIGGVDVHLAEAAELARLRAGIGVAFQSGALFGSMTLAENVALPLREITDLKAAEVADMVKMKLGLVGLAGYQNHMPSELSGGMQKRAGLARALALDPAVVFFDEPSAGLDPITSASLDQMILDIRAALGTTLVIVTHELASIYAVADRVVMLDKSVKGVLAVGTPEELRDHEHPQVRAFFHRQAGI